MSMATSTAPAATGVAASVSSTGEFQRKDSVFRDWITKDGEFQPEAGRYHLYVSLACPWAHRTLIVRALKGLEKAIDVTVVDWLMLAEGWRFNTAGTAGRGDKDPINGFERLRQLYELVDPGYQGRVTVPVLFDKKLKRIVNNESSEIIQMLNSQFNAVASKPELDLYPAELKADVDSVNEWIYPQINNGVYKCGFATTQTAYDEALAGLFAGLDRAESLLAAKRYLTSNTKITLADVRLFTTLIRFDTVYHTHFKCNRKKLLEYPNLHGFMLELYQQPAIRATVDHAHIKQHYYSSHRHINPHGIVAGGPDLASFDVPHGRDKKFP